MYLCSITYFNLIMKTGFFLIFFTIVTLLFALINYAIFSKAVQAFPHGSPLRTGFTILFWVLASTFILARILERYRPCGLTGILTWIGSFWMAFMVYGSLAILLIELGRLSDYLFHWYPTCFTADIAKTKMVVFLIVTGAMTLLVVYGFLNARIPAVRQLDLKIDKKVTGLKTLTVVAASDIHMGTLIAKRKVTRLVETINSLNPDIVLFAGDLVDEYLVPVIKNDLGKSLSAIRSKLGVYAVTGNHEYIGGAGPAVDYLQAHGVIVLRDTVVMPEGTFYLAGREDRDKLRFSGKPRKSLKELLHGTDFSRPVILMDHQPFNLGETAIEGVDLSLSGHTHHGQIWPFNYITKAIYELSRGYKKIGNTHFYVSSGFGTWGPPIRIGNRPEIVVLHLKFN